LKKTFVSISRHRFCLPGVQSFFQGGPPTVALFAANARKKREAYRNSEFAPRILADNDIPVVMKVNDMIKLPVV
jgi:hypothetical protein